MVFLSLFVFGGIHGVPHGEGASAAGSDGFDAVEIVDAVVESDETTGFGRQLGFDALVRIGEQEITAHEFVVQVEDGTERKGGTG